MCEKRIGNERVPKVRHTRRADGRERFGRRLRIEVRSSRGRVSIELDLSGDWQEG